MYNTCNRAANAQQFNHPFAKFAQMAEHKFGKGPQGGGLRRPKYNVPVNITDTESCYKVYVYAVGFDKENIKISVSDGVLHVSGTGN